MTEPAPLPLCLVLRVADGTASQSDIARFDAWHAANTTQVTQTTEQDQRLREAAEEDAVLDLLSDEVIERLLQTLREGSDDPFAGLGAGADISDLVAAVDDPDPALVQATLSSDLSRERGACAQLYCVAQIAPRHKSHDLSAYQQDFLSEIIQEYLILIWSLQKTRPDRAA